MMVIEKGRPLWISLFLLILLSNFMLYNTPFGENILPAETKGVVLGSLLDLIIILPVLFMLSQRKFSIKTTIVVAAAGCILARLIIPEDMLAPFAAITWAGIAIEAALVIFELLLIVTFVRYLPKIITSVKESALPSTFAFPDAVGNYVKKNPIIQVLCMELFMLYYALFAWRKKAPEGITLHKNSSYMAFMMMLIHAIILESLGLHWWLHEKSAILSIILLVLNIYSVFFFLGEMNAVRLHPIHLTNDAMYISFGFAKRAKISFEDIEAVVDEPAELEKKRGKDTLDFIAREFEEGHPQMILQMKRPVTAHLLMGMEKEYTRIAIRCDQPIELKEAINRGMEN
ncbi:MAG: beta-carotene 15,15'-monooxygenase [Lysinibacillus sp.]